MVAKAILKMQCSFRFDGFTSLWNSVQIDQNIRCCKNSKRKKFNFTPNSKISWEMIPKIEFSLSVLRSRKLDELATQEKKNSTLLFH